MLVCVSAAFRVGSVGVAAIGMDVGLGRRNVVASSQPGVGVAAVWLTSLQENMSVLRPQGIVSWGGLLAVEVVPRLPSACQAAGSVGQKILPPVFSFYAAMEDHLLPAQ